MSHDPRHDEVLQRLREGDLAEGAREARAVLEACAECRETWRTDKALLADVRSSFEFERRTLEEARALPEPPGEREAQRELRARLAREEHEPRAATRPGSTNALSRRWMWLAIAAGLALVVWFALPRAPHPGDDQLLGTHALVLPVPEHLPSGSLKFAWKGTVSRNARVSLLIEGRGSADNPWTRLVTQTVDASSWEAAPAQVASWPNQLRAKVEVRDLNGELAEQGQESDWSPVFSPR